MPGMFGNSLVNGVTVRDFFKARIMTPIINLYLDGGENSSVICKLKENDKQIQFIYGNQKSVVVATINQLLRYLNGIILCDVKARQSKNLDLNKVSFKKEVLPFVIPLTTDIIEDGASSQWHQINVTNSCKSITW